MDGRRARMGSAVCLACVIGFSSATRPSPGCRAPDPPLRPGEPDYFKMTVDDTERTFWFKLPVKYIHSPEDPVPFVVSFHGWRGTGENQMRSDELGILGDEETFAAAWPDGYGDHHVDTSRIWNSWNGVGSADSPGIEGPTCSPYVTEDFCYASCKRRPQGCDRCDWTTCVDDIAFVEALLDSLSETYCLDLDRLYATGFSNGGMFSWQVATSLAHRFAAVAPGGGQPFVGFVHPPDLRGGHRVSIMDFHGLSDIICPPFGGESGGGSSTGGWLYAPVSTCTRAFAQEHGCAGRDEVYPTPFDDHVTCYKHGQCQDSAEFVRCLWEGGHTWPKKHPSTGEGLDGTRLVWWFLSNHPFIPPKPDATNTTARNTSRYAHRSAFARVFDSEQASGKRS